MGYSTDFSGSFVLNKKLDKETHEFLIEFSRARHEDKSYPGIWCQWIPDESGSFIEWDGGEKFYNYIEWIEYIIEKILAPKGYVLNGDVSWSGEDPGDTGKIHIEKNHVTSIPTEDYEEIISRILKVKALRPLLIGIHPTLDHLIEPLMKGKKK